MIVSIQKLVSGKLIVLSCGKDYMYLMPHHQCPQIQKGQMSLKHLNLQLLLHRHHMMTYIQVFETTDLHYKFTYVLAHRFF